MVKRNGGPAEAPAAFEGSVPTRQAEEEDDPSAPVRRALHLTKECSEYTGLAGSFCTITSSNIPAIAVGSTVIYASAAGEGSIDSDIVLEAGNHTKATGHVVLDFASNSGSVTFTGGTGALITFDADAVVSFDGTLWHWDGTYTVGPTDDN